VREEKALGNREIFFFSAASVCVYESESERGERERGAPERSGLGSIVFSGKIWAVLRLRQWQALGWDARCRKIEK
jgi:hypothetical protein